MSSKLKEGLKLHVIFCFSLFAYEWIISWFPYLLVSFWKQPSVMSLSPGISHTVDFQTPNLMTILFCGGFVVKLCLTFYLLDCSPPGSSVHGILQAWILEWVAISFSRGSSWSRDRTHVSCIAGRFFTDWTTTFVNKAVSENNMGFSCTLE